MTRRCRLYTSFECPSPQHRPHPTPKHPSNIVNFLPTLTFTPGDNTFKSLHFILVKPPIQFLESFRLLNSNTTFLNLFPQLYFLHTQFLRLLSLNLYLCPSSLQTFIDNGDFFAHTTQFILICRLNLITLTSQQFKLHLDFLPLFLHHGKLVHQFPPQLSQFHFILLSQHTKGWSG